MKVYWYRARFSFDRELRSSMLRALTSRRGVQLLAALNISVTISAPIGHNANDSVKRALGDARDDTSIACHSKRGETLGIGTEVRRALEEVISWRQQTLEERMFVGSVGRRGGCTIQQPRVRSTPTVPSESTHCVTQVNWAIIDYRHVTQKPHILGRRLYEMAKFFHPRVPKASPMTW
jgi:hypothetical protein